MPKTTLSDAASEITAMTDEERAAAPAPVVEALVKDSGPQFVIDQMCDTLERARIGAQGRMDDLSIRWGHENGLTPDQLASGSEPEEGDEDIRRFWVAQDGFDILHGLTVDEAKAALDAIGTET